MSADQRQEARDWINTVGVLATVLIGVGTLWTTYKVSGLEDYFHSEVKRKNTEYALTAEQASRLDKETVEAWMALDRLQVQLSNLTSTAQNQQSQYDLAENKLNEARSALARTAIESTSAELRVQEANSQVREAVLKLTASTSESQGNTQPPRARGGRRRLAGQE